MSTFHGLEMAKQALFAQQSALYTTGHNISNMNTEGYSRQRVNFETMSPYPAPSRNRPQMPGQMGTGVQIGTIERLRNSFLDQQYRAENSKLGYYAEKSDALSRMEGVLNEPSDSGLAKVMDQFKNSLGDISANSDNSGARAVVAQRGLAVAETFNHLSKSLNSIRTDLKSQIGATVNDANSLVRQINNLNEQIQKVEPHGMLPNDLYDERDRLVDKLSGIVNIKVSYDKSSSSSMDIGQGIAKIELVDDKGGSLDSPPVYLLEGKSNPGAAGIHEVSIAEDANGNITGIKIGTGDKVLDPMASMGSLKGLIESYGYDNGDGLKGQYPEMIAALDKMAFAFATEFNRVHKVGDDGINFFDLEGINPPDYAGAAGAITVNQAILKDPSLIATSTDGTAGNVENAFALRDVFDKPLDNDKLDGKSVTGFYQSLIGKLGVDAQESNRMVSNTVVLQSQVQNQRLSVSAVSLDEEMTNMIQFQHAYNAAARSMTTTDEMLDRIINGMGLVGR